MENKVISQFIYYPKCTTCQKAEKWLKQKGIQYEVRNIKEDNPTYDELKGLYEKSGLTLKRFFNVSGVLYKEMGLKDKLDKMNDDEKLRLLATDGMLVKRPIFASADMSIVLVGFKEKEWETLL